MPTQLVDALHMRFMSVLVMNPHVAEGQTPAVLRDADRARASFSAPQAVGSARGLAHGGSASVWTSYRGCPIALLCHLHEA